MNHWMSLSIEYANQKSYLDDLFQVYPTILGGMRNINPSKWENVKIAFEARDDEALITELLKLELFPIKNSYIGYFRMDKQAIKRNPITTKRICDALYEMGLDEIFEKCSQPKETNRQMGSSFKHWLEKKVLGIEPVGLKEFTASENNAILKGSDKELLGFAKENFGYNKEKGLDLIARFNKKYVLGEAKFITSEGGNQDKSLVDVFSTLTTSHHNVIPIGIIDGVPWIKDCEYYTDITTKYQNHNIMSALVLRDFLYSL